MTVIERMLAAVRRRLALMVTRALVISSQDGGPVQLVKLRLLDGEGPRERVERLGLYGVTSRPLPADAEGGPEAVALSVGGDRGHLLVVAFEDRRYRLRALAPGEVALYDDLGHVVHLKRDRVRVEAPDQVEVIAPKVRHGTAGGATVLQADADAGTILLQTGEGATDSKIELTKTKVTITGLLVDIVQPT